MSGGCYRECVKVVVINTQYIETDARSFKSVVQSLTGKDSPAESTVAPPGLNGSGEGTAEISSTLSRVGGAALLHERENPSRNQLGGSSSGSQINSNSVLVTLRSIPAPALRSIKKSEDRADQLAFSAEIGGLLFGVISRALLYIRDDFESVDRRAVWQLELMSTRGRVDVNTPAPVPAATTTTSTATTNCQGLHPNPLALWRLQRTH
nr:VQ motif-containing protein 1-like [Ipomoea batatas]GME08640.1 VQ motif-containing protein 1-like [Ipomoea batatas]